MVPADDQARPARHDAADELCGVDLILECERAASPAIRAIAIRNDGPRPPGDATSTRRHTHQAS